MAAVGLAAAVFAACGAVPHRRPAAPAAVVVPPAAARRPEPAVAPRPVATRHLVAHRRPAPPPPSINVLEYHAVLPEADIAADPTWRKDPYVMSRRRFSYQMAELAKAGYHTLTARQFVAIWEDRTRPLPARTVLITFDDGYADTERVAEPIMARYGFRGTLFLIGALLGAHSPWPPQPVHHDPMLDAGELHVLVAAGWDIESHTFRLHLLPLHALEAVTEPEATADLAREDRLLHAVAGASPVAFAYPEGALPPGLFAAVKRGYRVAFVGGDRPLTRFANPYLLPRWVMTAHTSLPWTLRLPPVPRRPAPPRSANPRRSEAKPLAPDAAGTQPKPTAQTATSAAPERPATPAVHRAAVPSAPAA